MTKAAQDLLAEALRLDVSERARIAAQLLESLDGEPEEGVEEAWAEEVERRMALIEAGTAKLEPWEDVKRRIENEILKR